MTPETTRPNRVPDCKVCCAAHDPEIHEATLSIHRWFRYQVTQYLYDPEQPLEQVAAQVA